MPTNKQGKDTKNLPINMPMEEKNLLGRLGAQAEPPSSAANYVRHCILKYLEINNPDAAKELIEIRKLHQEKIDKRRSDAIQRRFPNSSSSAIAISGAVSAAGEVASHPSQPTFDIQQKRRPRPQKKQRGRKGSIENQ